MCSTLRLGYSVMVSATDSDSVGRGSNPCTPAFFISCRFFFYGAVLLLRSFPFFSAAVLSAFGFAAFPSAKGQ